MTDNNDRPLKEVEGFIDSAGERGCYTPSQVGSYKSALKLALGRVGDETAQAEYITSKSVGEFAEDAPRLLDEHGAHTSTKASSIAVYKARLKRLGEDFCRWNGGNFLAWKEENEKKAPSGKKRKAKVAAPVSNGPEQPTPNAGGMVSHRILLSGGRTGSLQLPKEPSQADIEIIWRQLDHFKTTLEFEATLRGDLEEAESE